MRILVTGACGFIGSMLVRVLRSERPEWSVVSLDALTYAGNLANLGELERDPRHSFVRGDIRDGAALESTFAGGIDAVLHLAAETHVDRSVQDPAIFASTNVVGTQRLLEAARAAGVGRFVQVSTDEVYGSIDGEPVDEDAPLRPSSPYSASKAGADLLALSYARTFGMDVVVTRGSNSYGPRQFPEKLIPLVILNAFAGDPVPVYGDGTNVRDWIHVEDHARGILAALERGRPGAVYNLGAGASRRNLDLVQSLLELCGRDRELIRFVRDRPGHDLRYALDAGRAARELGWQPRMRIEEGLTDTVRWYRENRTWCDSVRSGEYRQYYERLYGVPLKTESGR